MARQKKPDTLGEVQRHYEDGRAELDVRITHKERGFDVYDRVFRNYIDPSTWPFRARVPDGRGATLLKRKTDRLLASRLAGRLIPRKDGSELKAKINTELILSQWQMHDLCTDEPILMKWRKVDQSARKYGAGFAFIGWNKDGDLNQPWMEHLENRDVITQPGVRSLEESDWVQVRRYVTVSELKKVNAKAKFGPIYEEKAIQAMEEDSAKDNKDYISVNKTVAGLNNIKSNRVEVVTEYRKDKWITFLPKLGDEKGMVLREIDNPFDDNEIHIIRLVYDIIDDDIYGVPELEAVLPLIKANWALLCQYLESAQNELYTPLMVNPQNVQMDTLKFDSGARWLMQRPGQDVMPFNHGTTSMQKFFEVYGLITSLIMEGMGESAQDVSQMAQKVGADKTATEVRDLSMMRTARDNANKIMLQLALSKMVYFWTKMNQQFLSDGEIVNIVGKEALEYFISEGLSEWTISDEGAEAIAKYAEDHDETWEQAYEEMRVQKLLDQYATPLYPVKNAQGETVPKLQIEKGEVSGHLFAEKSDYKGDFDFLADVDAMGMPNDQSDSQNRQLFMQDLEKIMPLIKEQGYSVKWKELSSAIAEKVGIKDSEKYFEKIQQQPQAPQAKIYESLAYKDAPEDIKRQIEAQAGLQPSQLPPVIPNAQQNGNLPNGPANPSVPVGAAGPATTPPGAGPLSQGVPPVGVPGQVPPPGN